MIVTQDIDTALDPIARPGTPEHAWQQWDRLRSLPALSLADIGSAVVLAPHPDDQILGFGGGLALLAERGVRLRVVVATDGEASHPRSRTSTASRLASVRRAEDAAALAAVHAGQAEVVRLGLPDSGLRDCRDHLAECLSRLVHDFDVCVAPWSGDMHPDHESVGRAAVRPPRGRDTPVWQYPVWMWHWAAPADERVPWDRARRLELPAWAWVRKQEAVACHRSQILPLGPAPEDAPILPASELAHFRRRYELVLR